MAMQPPDSDGIISSHVLAGLLGSLVGLRWAPGATWVERVANVAIGFGCAVYITPGVAEWTGIDKPRALAALSFATGMFGLSLSAAVVDVIKQARFADVLSSWLTRR